MAWEISSSEYFQGQEANFAYWKGLEISLFNVTKSVELTCHVKDICARQVSLTVQVTVLEPGDPVCHEEVTQDNITWPAEAVGHQSITRCPAKFEGYCYRNCLENGTAAAWEDAYDCSSCIYIPWMEMISDQGVMLQGRGYPDAFQNATALAEIFADSLKIRTAVALPGELIGITRILEKFIFSKYEAVTLSKFVKILQLLLEIFQPSIKSTVALRSTIAKFLEHTVSVSHLVKPENVEYASIYLQQNFMSGSSFNINLPNSMNIAVSRFQDKDEDIEMNVGLVTYLHPGLLLPKKATQEGKNFDLPIKLLDKHLVDVMVYPPSVSDQLILNIVFNIDEDLAVIDREDGYVWSKVCGQIDLKDDKFYQNLSRCSSNETAGVLRCHCNGTGLFGMFWKATIEKKAISKGNELTDVTVLASCTTVMAVITMFMICLMYWWPRLLDARRRSKQRCQEASKATYIQPVFNQDSSSGALAGCVAPRSVLFVNNNENNKHIPVRENRDDTDSEYIDMSRGIHAAYGETVELGEVHTYINVVKTSVLSENEPQSEATDDGKEWVSYTKDTKQRYLPMVARNCEIEVCVNKSVE